MELLKQLLQRWCDLVLERSDIGIALLDNGVDEKVFSLCGLSNIIQQNQRDFDDDSDIFIHGTNCAIVIGMNCANSRIFSYKILDSMGRGSVDALEAAFDWCLMNNIRLVNLSFGTTHFKDKKIIRQVVNRYVNKGLFIVAATANSGYTTYPASISSVVGVKAGDKFDVDDECLQCIGVDYVAPSEHKFQFAGNDIILQKSNSYAAPYVTAMVGHLIADRPEIDIWQIKKLLNQRFGKECVQYTPDWIEKGYFVRKTSNSRAEVYFDVVSKMDEADTVILCDKKEIDRYKDKHIVYLGLELYQIEDSVYFFWSRINREKQIEETKEKRENINIPIINIEFDKKQDYIWWLTEIKNCFEEDGYNAYTTSSEPESVLYDLEYIPVGSDENIANKISDFLYWQTYYNQSDLIIYGIEVNEPRCNGIVEDILLRIENKEEKTNIQIYCDGIQRRNMEYSIIEKQQIREVYDSLICFMTEGADEQ